MAETPGLVEVRGRRVMLVEGGWRRMVWDQMRVVRLLKARERLALVLPRRVISRELSRSELGLASCPGR